MSTWSKHFIVISAAMCFMAADAVADGPLAAITVVVNEVNPDGPNGETDEFLELRNVSGTDQDLDGMAVHLYSRTCRLTAAIDLDGIVLAPKAATGDRFVISGPGFTRTVSTPHHLPSSLGLDSSAGAITLMAGPQRVDGLGWTSPLTAACRVEGNPAQFPQPAPGTAGLSLTRDVLGTDTNDNRRDFHLDFPSP